MSILSLIVGTPVNKPNSRKADNLKHSPWEANVITDIRLSQADSVDIDMDECLLKIVSKISDLHSRSSFRFKMLQIHNNNCEI